MMKFSSIVRVIPKVSRIAVDIVSKTQTILEINMKYVEIEKYINGELVTEVAPESYLNQGFSVLDSNEIKDYLVMKNAEKAKHPVKPVYDHYSYCIDNGYPL